MARPNNQTAIQAYVRGLREAKAAFQALPEVMRDRLNAATELTIRETVREAKARILASPSVRTRALYDSIGWSMNYKNGKGRAGVQRLTTTFMSAGVKVKIKGRYQRRADGSWDPTKIQPTRYAHLVEFGTKKFPAEPFMIPALEGQKAPYLDRVKAAGHEVETDLSAIGSRTR